MPYQLLLLIKQKDVRAQEEFYRKFKHQWLYYCLRKLHHREWAEEAMLDGFAQVFISFEKFEFRSNGQMSAYLETIFRNCCEKKRRLITRYSFIVYPGDEPEELSDEAVDHELNRLQLKQILEAMDHLTSIQQDVFKQRMSGASFGLIAHEANITENNASQIYKAAKKRITQYIQQQKKQHDVNLR